MLITLISICTPRIARVRSTAIIQPVSAYIPMVKGAPQTRMARYCRASVSTSAEAGARRKAPATSGACAAISTSPATSPMPSARTRCAPLSPASPAPWLCATSPEVPIRRKPNTQ